MARHPEQARKNAPFSGAGTKYRRREPENTALYKAVQENYKSFLRLTEEKGKFLPKYVEKEFEDFLKCGILAHGFLRLQCVDCKKERMVAFSCKKRGFCSSCGGRRMCASAAHLVDEVFPYVGVRQWVLSFPFPVRFLLAKSPNLQAKVLEIVLRVITQYLNQKLKTKKLKTGAVTIIQRFGGSLNLNPHLHMLVLDGCYDADGNFHEIEKPTNAEIAELVEIMGNRILRFLRKRGHLKALEEDAHNDPELLEELQAASVQSRSALNPAERIIKIGSNGKYEPAKVSDYLCALKDGFSLHAGIYCGDNEREKLERLCRYVARPAVAEKRLGIAPDGQKIIYELKKAYGDGTTHLVLTPMQFMEKLAAMVPKPRVHLTRFHGVLAPNAKIRKKIIPRANPEKNEEVRLNPRPPPGSYCTAELLF